MGIGISCLRYGLVSGPGVSIHAAVWNSGMAVVDIGFKKGIEVEKRLELVADGSRRYVTLESQTSSTRNIEDFLHEKRIIVYIT